MPSTGECSWQTWCNSDSSMSEGNLVLSSTQARLMARGGSQQQHQPYQQQRTLPCQYYQRGHCSYGNSCKYSHDVPQFAASSSTAGPTAGSASHPAHSRTGSAGSSASGGGGSSRVRADGQLAGAHAAANTQDPALSVEDLARLGEQSVSRTGCHMGVSTATSACWSVVAPAHVMSSFAAWFC